MWSGLYKKDQFEKLVISQKQLDSPDPVDAFVYMEFAAVQEILIVVNESIQTIDKVLKGTEMLTANS
jgi:hypothetical protein